MSLKLIAAPGEEPVRLDEARAHCRITDEVGDDLLGLYITAARELCESITGRVLVTQTWEQTLDDFPRGDKSDIQLLRLPVQSVQSVVYVDADGAEQTLASDQYATDLQDAEAWVLPADGLTWPTTDDVINAVKVQFVAGYGDAASVPKQLKVWILATVAMFATQREAVDMTGRVGALPERLIDRMLDSYRVY
ncbi:phage head-tail connector protein [Pelomonas sp. V22]|uniref:head-tail connector protein n=1 Tax=Pelomonas sp. V22 TaxID=2822139 RepID=UPI0024A80FFB|nr:head-tail connector protein [Pelomonas sp. V22]MDI4633294.1 phage head-tail connector protein [Pelomonas sp. V22]